MGAGGCLAVGSNMIRGGEMAEDFYYIREQRRGNVQVGAALVLMGALYVAEGALRWENVQKMSITVPQSFPQDCIFWERSSTTGR